MSQSNKTTQNGRQAGEWRWSSDGENLHVSAAETSRLSDLAGKWTLEAFGLQLDGLSRSRLGRTLKAGSGAVSCAIGLSDGRRIQLVGEFQEDGAASGVLIEGMTFGAQVLQPGPTLTPAYQPIISLRTGGVAGFEALARWSGSSDDASFEDPALATNMLIHAAQALSVWRETMDLPDLFVQVNLTARDLARGDVVDLIETLITGYKLPRGALKIELTEQAALRNRGLALETVIAIKEAGAGLVLDDFGSGHSSFAWLADIPADALKIDSELTSRLGDDRMDHILEAITLLAVRLDMEVTAEGVEDKANVSKLRALGFTYVQGFAFSKPMEHDAALEFLKKNKV